MRARAPIPTNDAGRRKRVNGKIVGLFVLRAAGSAALPVAAPVSKPAIMRTPSKPAAMKKAFASEEDDTLLLYAKAALNRGNSKQSFDYVSEHERRFPNSPNARHRAQLRQMIVAVRHDKP
jgi:hypothetical protein